MSKISQTQECLLYVKYHLHEVEKLANLINVRTQRNSGLLGSWNEYEGGMRELFSVKE